MTSHAHALTTDVPDYVGIAASLVPVLLDRGAAADREGQVPEETLADVAPLLAMSAPYEWGGGAADLPTFLAVSRTLAQGCPATAWTVSFLIEHNAQLAKYPRRLAETIRRGRAYVPMAATQAGSGTARPVDGGHRVSGHWRYATAITYSEWLWVTATTADRGDLLRFFLPVSDVEIRRTWDMSGMRATGSHDIVLDDVFVPDHLSLHNDTARSAADDGADAYATDFVRYSTVAAVGLLLPSIAVGAAEGALRLYQESLHHRRAPFSSTLLTDSPAAQRRLALAFGTVESAREALEAGLGHIVDSYARTRTLDATATLRFKLAAGRATTLAAEAIEVILRGSGASVFDVGNPLQRFRRDIDVLCGHVTLDQDWLLGSIGESLLSSESGLALNKGFV